MAAGAEEWDLRLNRLSLQQSLVEQLVELLLVLLSIDHPFSQVAQPKPSTGVRKRRIHHLEESHMIMEHPNTRACLTPAPPTPQEFMHVASA